MPPPRPCDEIQAIAEAGPHWNDFSGDGASIPWEWFPPPISWGLFTFKAYLDQLAPECFKLHDYLYSQLSIDLGVTREEADLCLFECLQPLDAVSATLVFAACTQFGEVYFHKFAAIANAHNMAVADRRIGGMATFKATMLFQLATNVSSGASPDIHRLAGWSESWYINAADINTVLNLLTVDTATSQCLCTARATILPDSASIVGQRIQEVPKAGRSQTFSKTFPGNPTFVTDTPWQSLLCTCVPASGGSIKRFTLRGIPDSEIVEGELRAGSIVTQFLFNQYFPALRNWGTRGQDPLVADFLMEGINGVGTLTTINPPPFVRGDRVRITGAVDALGVKRSYAGLVLTVNGPTSFTVQNWPWGACTGGLIAPINLIITTLGLGNFAIGRIVNRKVGRPFIQYRGRRSKRRAKA